MVFYKRVIYYLEFPLVEGLTKQIFRGLLKKTKSTSSVGSQKVFFIESFTASFLQSNKRFFLIFFSTNLGKVKNAVQEDLVMRLYLVGDKVLLCRKNKWFLTRIYLEN